MPDALNRSPRLPGTLLVLAVLVAVAMLVAAPLHAQAPHAAAAEQVAREAFAALEGGRWRDAAALVDASAIRRFREGQLEMLRLERELPAADLLADDSAVPAAVREWLLERQREAREMMTESWRLANRFAGVDSAAQVERLDGAELLARYIEAQDPRGRNTAALGGQQLPRVRRTVVGTLTPNDSVAHVLYERGYRHDNSGDAIVAMDELSIATLRHGADGWRIWSTPHDHEFVPSAFGGVTAFGIWTTSREVANRPVTWPQPGLPDASASLGGYTGGIDLPESLVIELPQRDGPPIRVEVPRAKFREIMGLLQPWM